MSSGPFITSTYETNRGELHPVKVQPETITLVLGGNANAANPGDRTSNIRARVTGSRRGYGVFCRTVSIKFADGSAPAGYKQDSVIRVPWLSPDGYEELGDGDTGLYLGVACVYVGKSPEKIK